MAGMRHYLLRTEWQLDAPVERVWEALSVPGEWPRWWRYLEAVVDLEPGDAQGVGALRRFTWTSRLPYRLSFDMRTTGLERPIYIEGLAAGELNGTGRWDLSTQGRIAHVQYTWDVAPAKRWMNRLAPLFAPVFEWNHHQVMRAGGHGLARHLGASLLAFHAAPGACR